MTLDDLICDYYLDLTPTGAEPAYLPFIDVEEVQNVTPDFSLDIKKFFRTCLMMAYLINLVLPTEKDLLCILCCCTSVDPGNEDNTMDPMLSGNSPSLME